jgi:hypothetical protein
MAANSKHRQSQRPTLVHQPLLHAEVNHKPVKCCVSLFMHSILARPPCQVDKPLPCMSPTNEHTSCSCVPWTCTTRAVQGAGEGTRLQCSGASKKCQTLPAQSDNVPRQCHVDDGFSFPLNTDTLLLVSTISSAMPLQ